MPRFVHGDNLTYRFFKDLFIKKPDLAVEFSRDLIKETAVWLPPDVYRRCPILLPWVVRDPDCRKNKRKTSLSDGVLRTRMGTSETTTQWLKG